MHSISLHSDSLHSVSFACGCVHQVMNLWVGLYVSPLLQGIPFKPRCKCASYCFSGREQQFELNAKYSADSPVPQGFESDIGRFMLGPPKPPSSGEKPKLKVMQLLPVMKYLGKCALVYHNKAQVAVVHLVQDSYPWMNMAHLLYS